MKYLVNKNSRRRGIAIELAIFTIMLCFGLSIIILTTSMIQQNNYNKVYSEYTKKLELERIGGEFCSAVKTDKMLEFLWKLEEETYYIHNYDIANIVLDVEKPVLQLKEEIDDENIKIVFIVELTPIKDGNGDIINYEITRWELK